jgi:HPt (histidine-containing phosphotransfer) domain-containing protein
LTFEAEIDPEALERLRQSATGNPETFVQEILTIYIDRLPEAIENLQKYAREQSYSKVIRVAHQLKGSSLSVGADRIAKYCKQLEQAVRESDTEKATQLIQTISVSSHQVIKNLRHFLAK